MKKIVKIDFDRLDLVYSIFKKVQVEVTEHAIKSLITAKYLRTFISEGVNSNFDNINQEQLGLLIERIVSELEFSTELTPEEKKFIVVNIIIIAIEIFVPAGPIVKLGLVALLEFLLPLIYDKIDEVSKSKKTKKFFHRFCCCKD